MPRDLILGTAGHIDHGKTTLVYALTGVDCDRLPEEKQRGITIDIGFAYLELGDYRLGIVDVPGHERFIRNMLAGATGIDIAMLVIAADDRIMPQTREHLDILKLLQIPQGVIVLTKCDLVDQPTLELLELEVRELVAGSFLASALIVPVSARTGLGIDALKIALMAQAAQIEQRQRQEWFRLCIDRAFVIQGHGTIVTGSVISGSLHVGQEIEWWPSGERVRVRGLNQHGHAVEEVHRGQRAALNLVGVPLEAVERGQEVATPGYLQPTRVLTVRLTIPAGGGRGVKHRLPVRLHIGTNEVMATLSLLDSDTLEPGQTGLGQLFLEGPVCATWRQPFVLRDSSAEHTLGGGHVLQPNPVKLRRRHIESLERIEKLESDDATERALVVAWFTDYEGVTIADWVRSAGLSPDEAEVLGNDLVARGLLVELTGGRRLPFERVTEIETRILKLLGERHEQFPLMSAHDRRQLQSQLDFLECPAIVHAVVDQLVIQKRLLGDQKRIAIIDFKPKLTINQRKLKDRLVAAHQVAGFQPPTPSDFENEPGAAGILHDLYEVCVAEGFLVKISPEIYLHADSEIEMRRRVLERFTSSEGLTVADIRDLLGTTRKYAVPFCEYLDRVGVTRRVEDRRYPASSA